MKLFNIKIVVVLDDFFPCICISLSQQGVQFQYTNLFSEVVFRRWVHTAYCPLGTGNSFPEGKGCISLQLAFLVRSYLFYLFVCFTTLPGSMLM